MSNTPKLSSTDRFTFVNTEFQNYGWMRMFVKWNRPQKYFSAYIMLTRCHNEKTQITVQDTPLVLSSVHHLL
jgi:hypothetical protein